jgi:hypothetical protein
MWWYNNVFWMCLTLENIKSEELPWRRNVLCYMKKSSWIFMIIECVIIFSYGLFISYFENYLDNYQFLIFNTNFGTLKKK